MMKIKILIVCLVLQSCNNFFYYPTRKLHYHPKKWKLIFENIFIKSKDGKWIHGWFFPSKNKNPKGTIIQFHGNAENISTHFLYLAWVVKHGYNLFTFDYRGYGGSQGEPSREKIQLDANSALEWVNKLPSKKKGEKIILFAQSLGGIIAMNCLLDLSIRKNIDLLVLDSTFSSYQRIAKDKLASFFITWLFQPLAYLLISSYGNMDNKIHKLSPLPILVIHGIRDKVVPFKFGQEIFLKAKAPKFFWKIKTNRHCSVFFVDKKKYRKKFINFIDKMQLSASRHKY